MKIPTVSVLLVAVVVLVVVGAFVHVLGGITRLLVVIVIVLGVVIWLRNSIAKRRSS